MITSNNYFNPEGCEILDEKMWELEKNTSGFIDFNRDRYSYPTKLYDSMVAAFWTMGEVDTSGEKKNFSNLTENEQNIYKYTFGQLSFNDSIQSFYLTDFLSEVNNSVMKATLIKQAESEVLHSKSYATLLDACGNSNEVFDLYKVDDMLSLKNSRISQLFARNINNLNTSEGMTLSAVASVALEGIFFMVGFSLIYVLGDKAPAARKTIMLIHRDEDIHMAMFANITKTLIRENNLKGIIVSKIEEMMKEAVDIELQYGLYLINKFPILGLRDDLLIDTINNFANKRMRALGLLPIFKSSPKTNLEVLVDKGLAMNDTKQNFFETSVSTYAKDSITMDF